MDGFIETIAGPVPRLRTSPGGRDHVGTLLVRCGIGRNSYKVIPGLYAVGAPTEESPVLVTANYKLSFDTLRCELCGHNVWILVVDTRGINVWCAAGKKTFCTEEVAHQVQRAHLDTIVKHRSLILPQLAATGVAAHKLKSLCGFSGRFGPVSARDIPRFLQNGRTVDEAMRSVQFSLRDRMVLIPVEITLVWKMFLLVVGISFAFSGIGPTIYSLQDAWQRGLMLTLATVIAVCTGAILVPIFLAWIPGRQFWLKGVLSGVLGWLAFAWYIGDSGPVNLAAQLLWITAVSSYMAMNFTGATPFTSLSGVKYEMRHGLAYQGLATVCALILWIAAPFFIS